MMMARLRSYGKCRFNTRWRITLTAALMLAAVLLVYCPPQLLTGKVALYGMDYDQLHVRRIIYARQAFLRGQGLPGWYSRELLGTPFWSNLHSFPWIPMRLFLCLIPPENAYAVGVALAATLAALFTFLFCRRLGFGLLASASVGWTFTCAGFFSARVMVGHLPLLEAYPLLPLLLWLVERYLACSEQPGPSFAALTFISLAAAIAALSGHPQLPAYALAASALYSFWRGGWRRGLAVAWAMAAGLAGTLFVWWPLVKLIGRSTRVAGLASAMNDLALPYGRLGAVLMPWKDGWPDIVDRLPGREFTGYPGSHFFWETVCYVGLVPLAATVVLVIGVMARRWKPDRTGLFFTALGFLALVTALPWAQELLREIPGTFLRSPARQLYLATFCLSLALGAAVHLALGWAPGRRLVFALILALLAFHGLDLGRHARAFVKLQPLKIPAPLYMEKQLRTGVGEGRVAMDFNLPYAANRAYDDVGFFDAIALTVPYRALLDLAHLPPDTNVEAMNGSDLGQESLAALCARFVVTSQRRSDLPLRTAGRGVFVYDVPQAAPRVRFFPLGEVLFEQGEGAGGGWPRPLPLEKLVLASKALLDVPEGGPSQDGARLSGGSSPRYERPSGDEIIVRLNAAEDGYVRLVEAWDPGWRALVDGCKAPLLCANGFLMAVRVPSGDHTIRLIFKTPGARTGLALSLLGPVLFLLLMASLRDPSRVAFRRALRIARKECGTRKAVKHCV